MLVVPLNVAEVPVLAFAPSEPNSTSVISLAVNPPTAAELPSASRGKCAISVCAFRPVALVIRPTIIRWRRVLFRIIFI
jgi:hypothetical protein